MKRKYKGKKINDYIVLKGYYNAIIPINNVNEKIKFIKINRGLKEETKKHKRQVKSEKNEFDRHIEHLALTETQINKRAINKAPTTEEMFFEKEGERQIIKNIWSLPEPQNRRVYMFIVEEFSLTEIAKIENRAIPVIKRSVDRGIKNLQEKLKKILKEG